MEVKVKASPAQLSKLRNGHRVRIQRPGDGSGHTMVVHPVKREAIEKAFMKGKGIDIELSAEEIEANKDASERMEGCGIFGKRFDRGIRKVLGKKAQKALYGEVRKLLPAAQVALTGGLTAAGTALGAAQPQLIPFIPAGVAALSALGGDYLNRPSDYQDSRKRGRMARSLAGRMAQDAIQQQVNQMTGDQDEAPNHAALASLTDNKIKSDINKEAVRRGFPRAAPTGRGLDSYVQSAGGRGLYVGGRGLYASGRGLESKSAGIVGLKRPAALRSQPSAAHWQWQYTIPKTYAHSASDKIGVGLYA